MKFKALAIVGLIVMALISGLWESAVVVAIASIFIIRADK